MCNYKVKIDFLDSKFSAVSPHRTQMLQFRTNLKICARR